MRIFKNLNCNNKVSVVCQYLYDDYKSSVREIFEKDIQTACNLFDVECMGATIRRGEVMITTGSRGRKLRNPKYIGLQFSFAVLEQDAEHFTESTFALMR